MDALAALFHIISAQYIIDSMAECTNVNLYYFFSQFRLYTHAGTGILLVKSVYFNHS